MCGKVSSSLLVFLCCFYHSGPQSTINIDININKNEDQQELAATARNITRNTTSTVYNAEHSDFENRLDSNLTDCQDKPVTVGSELKFGSALDNVIGLEGNLSWSESNIVNMECVTEFVLMMREADNASSAATVLCPGYQMRSAGLTYWCEYTLSQDRCGSRLRLMLESWSHNRMIQPSTIVTVDCSQQEEEQEREEEEEEEVVASWQMPLVLASLKLFSDATQRNNESRGELGCTWSQWSPWSSCSLTCGGAGSRTRRRSQAGSRVCTEVEEDRQDCQTNLCPLDCQLSVWADWSACSRSCGLGVRTRLRNITRPAENWGAACPSNLSEEETCEVEECRVDGGWSSWSRWGYCSQTCGPGSRSRSRSCTEPPPQHGGRDCAGASLETKECSRRSCPPVDGGWTSWTRWTPCTTTCGRGEQRRTRTCTEPPAAHGGRECGGERFQTNTCLLRRCPGEPGLVNRAKLDTAAARADGETEDEESCGPPPTVLGFLDPVVSHSVATYSCSRGRVLDPFTNRRTFSLACSPEGGWELPTSWPVCSPPTHCVGPVRTGASGLHPPLPRRDLPVNTGLTYRCSRDPELAVSGGCFYDGVVRYDPAYPSCAQSHAELDLCSQAGGAGGASDNSNVIIAVPSLNSSSHGWLTSPGYPAASNRSASCSWNIKAPHGFILAIGIEDIGFQPASNNTTSAALELTEAGPRLRKTFVKQKDLGRTFFSQDNSVVVRSLPDIKQFWRINYLVLTPT